MQGHRRRDILAGLGAAGLWAVPGVAARASSPDGIVWGVNGHPFSAYPGIPLEQQLALVRELGMTHYRVGNRNNGLARLYPLAKKAGVELLPLIPPGGDLATTSAEKLYDLSYRDAQAVTRQHRGRFPVWELGNELENFAIIKACEMRDDGTQYPCEWGPAGGVGALDYYGPRWKKVSAALAGLLDGAKAGDPGAQRAIGTAGWGHIGAFERMAADGLEWEISVWHDYSQIGEDFLTILAGYGKPIWITEFNAGGGGFESEDDNARMITDRIAYYRRMAKRYRIEAAFVYELLDEPYWTDFEGKMGLYRMEGSEADGWRVGEIKPVGEAVKSELSGGR